MPMPCSAHAQIFLLRMSPDRGDVVTLEQRVQHIGRQLHDLGLVVGPDEAARLQAFHKKPEAAAIPGQYFYTIAPPVAEDVKRSVHRVQPHRLLDENRKTVHAVAEINGVAVQVHLQVVVEAEHGSLPRIWTSVVSSSMVAIASPSSSATPFDSRTCNASVSVGGSNVLDNVVDGGAAMTGTNADGVTVTGMDLCEPGRSMVTPSLLSSTCVRSRSSLR